MTGNRSLDEFAGGDDSDDPAPAGSPDAPEPAPADTQSVADDEDDAALDAVRDEDGESVEPMAETFAWSADGGQCASCGATVEARWRDGDDLVCADCKAW